MMKQEIIQKYHNIRRITELASMQSTKQLFRKQSDVMEPVSALPLHPASPSPPQPLSPSHPGVRVAHAIIDMVSPLLLPVPLYTDAVGFTRKRAQRARPCCKSKLGNAALDIDRFNHSAAAFKFLVICSLQLHIYCTLIIVCSNLYYLLYFFIVNVVCQQIHSNKCFIHSIFQHSYVVHIYQSSVMSLQLDKSFTHCTLV